MEHKLEELADHVVVVLRENPLSKGRFESAGASDVVIAIEIVADALVGKLTTLVEATP